FNAPTSNDKTWADAVDTWGLWNADSASDGMGLFSMTINDLDDYAYAPGCFDWWFMPKGVAILHPAALGMPQVLEIQVTEIGVYARDSYDFNGSQILGIWDVDAETLSLSAALKGLIPLLGPALAPGEIDKDARYRPKMGDTYVRNSSY